MAYSKQTWADGPGGGTPITAARLAHIENGIEASASTADDATTTANAAITPAELNARVPDPSGQVDNRFLTTSSGTLVYADAPEGGGGGAPTADPINVTMDAGTGRYKLTWTPEYSGIAIIDGPVFSWNTDWIDFTVYDDETDADAYNSNDLAYGYWHYDPTQPFTVEDSFDHQDRYSPKIPVVAGTTYYIIFDATDGATYDISAILASLQHLGGLSTLGFGITGPIVPAAFPESYFPPGSIYQGLNPGAFPLTAYAHAEGLGTVARASATHAEGLATEALASGAHSEGRYSVARYPGAHASQSYRFNSADPPGKDQYERIIMGTFGVGPLRYGNGEVGISPLPHDSIVMINALIVSRDAAGTAVKVWRLEGLVSSIGSSAATPTDSTILGTPTVTVLLEEGASTTWGVELRDNSTGVDFDGPGVNIWMLNIPTNNEKTVAKVELIEIGPSS